MSKEPRSHVCVVACGRKSTGKSTKINEIAEAYFKAHNKKVLVVDVNAAPPYRKHQLLTEKNFVHWCRDPQYVGIKRFYLMDEKKMLHLIADHFKSGLIIFEDCTGYIDANPRKEIKQFLTNHRMFDADLIFTFHSIMGIPPFFWKMTNNMLLFKTQEYLEEKDKSSMKRIPNYIDIYKAYSRLKKSKNNYLNISIDLLV